jgi:subtilisin family serine protease
MKKLFLIFSILWFSIIYSQDRKVYKYNVHLTNASLIPDFDTFKGKYQYIGDDYRLKYFFEKYEIIKFEKYTGDYNIEAFEKILYIETYSKDLIKEMFDKFPAIFEKYEDVSDENIELLYYPNDYGTTHLPNAGAAVRRDDLDYINVQKAWDLTTGLNSTGTREIVGISDARIKEDYGDFNNFSDKLRFTTPTPWTQSVTCNPNLDYTSHGTFVASIAAAQGDNQYGSTGVCYDCKIIGTTYGNPQPVFLQLAKVGVRVINMSWTSYRLPAFTKDFVELQTVPPNPNPTQQAFFNTLADSLGIVLVAAAGNNTSYQTANDWRCNGGNQTGPYWTGTQFYYPAASDNVISVSAVNQRFPFTIPLSSINQTQGFVGNTPNGSVSYFGLQDSFAHVDARDPFNPVGMIFSGWAFAEACNNNSYFPTPNGLLLTHTSNSAVDILAPNNDVFLSPLFAETGVIAYGGGGTSGSAPLVSGTAALMISLNHCLTSDEVDDILKLTTKDVEVLSINQIFKGQIGAGALNAGDAVEFVNEMRKSDGNAVIDNHIFWRFNFFLPRINNRLTINNITFSEQNISKFIARNIIDVTNSDFHPDNSGLVDLMIDSNITVCTPATDFDAIRVAFFSNSKIKKSKHNKHSSIRLYPNPNKGSFTIDLSNEQKDITISVIDIMGKQVYNQRANGITFELDLPNLPSGLYFIKLTSNDINETLKFIKE